jgi:hypothetical protein
MTPILMPLAYGAAVAPHRDALAALSPGRWESGSADVIGPLPETPRGHTAILVFVDRLSKYLHCVPTTQKLTALGFAHLLVTHIFANHGMPRYVISDRDAQWNNHFWNHLARALGVKHHMSTAYHPQTD